MFLRIAVTTALLGGTLAAAAPQLPQPPVSSGFPGMPAQPPVPPRAGRPGEDPQKGTSVLRGWVTAADTGDPIRRAMVRAASQDGRQSGIAITDADGRFEIKDLPGGRYTVSATKAGYVSMSYGQRRPEQPGTVLEIIDGTIVEKLALALSRGGVITGSILDEFGDPVAGAQVSALRHRYINGARRLTPSGMGSTDDRGVYRIFGLAPGEYFISAAMRGPETMIGTTTTVSSAPVDGYAPTYYPGTPNASEAARVQVRAGQETTNISVALVAARLARISGRVVTSTNAPVVQGAIRMRPVDRSAMTLMVGLGSAMTRPDGSFQLLGVMPGSYELSVIPRGMPGPDTEYATVRVTVGAGDLENVLLVTSRGAIARGVITTDEGVPPPMRPEQVSVFARPAVPDSMAIGGGPGTVQQDWTFELTNLSDSRLLGLNLAGEPAWHVKAVLLNGVDVTDRPIDFVPGQTVEGLEIVMSRRQTELSGRLLDDRGAADTDATVVVFSQDPERWGFATRYVRTARPNQDGRYTLRGMPPHDYLVVAVKDLEPGQFQDPEFLESVRAQAVRVSLGEHETKVQDLKVLR